MTKHVIFLLVFILLIPSMALPQKAKPVIGDFKVQPLYRAAKLTWKAQGDLKGGMVVQILRSDTPEEGSYKEVATVNLTSDKTNYVYTDKSMGAEAKYYYKLVVKETNDSLGPIVARPFFSPPAT